jgi:hypothetical protein
MPLPRSDARKPSRYVSAEEVVLGPAGCPQRRFLVSYDKHVHGDREEPPYPRSWRLPRKKAWPTIADSTAI